MMCNENTTNKEKNTRTTDSVPVELELIQTQMAQKPMLRAEVHARPLRATGFLMYSFYLGLPLWSHLTVTGNFNSNMMLKIEF